MESDNYYFDDADGDRSNHTGDKAFGASSMLQSKAFVAFGRLPLKH